MPLELQRCAGDVPGDPQKMWVRTSSNGVDWSVAQQISTSAPGVHNGFPAVAASRTTAGEFRVVWQDDREASQMGWNTWMRRSLDGGLSWSPALRSGSPRRGWS